MITLLNNLIFCEHLNLITVLLVINHTKRAQHLPALAASELNWLLVMNTAFEKMYAILSSLVLQLLLKSLSYIIKLLVNIV